MAQDEDLVRTSQLHSFHPHNVWTILRLFRVASIPILFGMIIPYVTASLAAVNMHVK